MLNLEGRVAAVFGLANKRSIAWAIAQQLQQAGAKLAIGYQNERMKQEAHSLIADLPAPKRSSATSPSTLESIRPSLNSRSAMASSTSSFTPSDSHPLRN